MGTILMLKSAGAGFLAGWATISLVVAIIMFRVLSKLFEKDGEK